MTKEMDFDQEGLANLAVALIDSVRKDYVSVISSYAEENKRPVQEWYDDHKSFVHSWGAAQFVIRDYYGIFSDFDAEGVFRTWNSLAQDRLDEKHGKKKKHSWFLQRL